MAQNEKKYLRELLEIHKKNLIDLQIQSAKYGALNCPIHILRQIEEEELAIKHLQEVLGAEEEKFAERDAIDALVEEVKKLRNEVNKLTEQIQTPREPSFHCKDAYKEFFTRNEGVIRDLALIFQTHFDRVDEEKIKDWLCQFDSVRKKELALTLLKHLQYIDDQRIMDIFEEFHRQLLKETPDADIIFSALGSLQDSGVRVSYPSSKTLKIEEKLQPKFLDLKNILTLTNLTGKSIVFIDDNIASGVQAVRVFNDLLGIEPTGYKRVMPLTLQEVEILKQAHLYFFTLVGFKEGVGHLEKKLKSLGLRIKCFSAIPIEKTCGCFEATSLIFNNKSDREYAKKMAQIIGYYLLSDKELDDEKKIKFALGYDNAQRLLVFSYNTPTCTLPILWKEGEYEGKKWVPLFSRKE